MGNLKEVKFRLNEDELSKAKKISEKHGMSINAVAKFLTLNLKVPETEDNRNELKELNRQIGAIGNNINQLARRVNGDKTLLRTQKQEILEMLHEIRNNTRKLLGKKPIKNTQEFQTKNYFK